MLSVEENRLLTESGPRTLAGDLSRRYWLSALQADETPDPDGAPGRVQILGEDPASPLGRARRPADAPTRSSQGDSQ